MLTNDQCKADYTAIGKVFSAKQFDDAVMCAGFREGYDMMLRGYSQKLNFVYLLVARIHVKVIV